MKNSRLSSIVQNLIAQRTTRESIRFAVGELIYDEEQLKHEWTQLTTSTSLANTKLNVRIIPAEQQCMWCFLVYKPNKKETQCPQCRSVGAKILSGEEFYLDED